MTSAGRGQKSKGILPKPLTQKSLFWFMPAFLVAIINDLLDLGVIGSLPIVGDAFDALSIMVNLFLIGKASALGLIEFVPFADILPLHSAAVMAAFLSHMAKPKR